MAKLNQAAKILSSPDFQKKDKVKVIREDVYFKVLKNGGVPKYYPLSYPCLIHCIIL